MSKNYYKVLGIEKNASQDDIKKAFRKLAHEHHPDKKTGNAEKFKEANEAYSVLSDDSKRQQYDTYGSAGPNMGGAGANGFGGQSGFGGFDFSNFQQGGNMEFDMGDIFSEFFGGGGGGRERVKRGRDISVDLDVAFADSIFGVERIVVINKTSACDECSGAGGKRGGKNKTCSTCKGAGKIKEIRRSIIGSFETSRVCDICHGRGQIPEEKCPKCHGAGVFKQQSEIKVKIPSGIENGETIRLSSAGEGVANGQAGDLYIKVHIKPHPVWQKEGHNLVTDLRIKLSDALLGSEYDLVTLDGTIKLKIPEGVSHGEILRVRGKGVPVSHSHRGDLLITIHIIFPRKLSKSAKQAIEMLKKEGM